MTAWNRDEIINLRIDNNERLQDYIAGNKTLRRVNYENIDIRTPTCMTTSTDSTTLETIEGVLIVRTT